MPTASWASVFRWGDVEVKLKESTHKGGTFGQYIHDVTFSVRNNNVEIATLSIPDLVCGASMFSNKSWITFFIRVKLHATQGIIQVSCDGVAQSVAYVNQNTVQTTPLASATEFYFSPPVFDNGTNSYVGTIDSIYCDESGFPDGTIVCRCPSFASDGTLVDAIARGTGVTTVADALASSTDAKQLVFTSASGKAPINMNAATVTGFPATIVGFQGVTLRTANRYPLQQRRVELGVQQSSVEYTDPNSTDVSLPFSSIVTPPATNGVPVYFNVFRKAGDVKFATADVASTQLLIKSNTP
jgi:hypothetical protein